MKPRFQFGLRTLFALTFVVAFFCSWFAWRIAEKQQERAAVKTLRENQCLVFYDYQVTADGAVRLDREPPGPEWLRRLLGDDYFVAPALLCPQVADDNRLVRVRHALRELQTVTSVRLIGGCGRDATDKGLVILADLTQLESIVFVSDKAITEASIPKLSRLTKLKSLKFLRPRLDDKPLRDFKSVLPRCKIEYVYDDDTSA